MISLDNVRLARAALCIAIAFVGGYLADVAGLPLPYMLGAIAATMFAAMAGAPIARPAPSVVIPMRATLGVLLGSTITPELLDRMSAVAGTAALVPLFVVSSAIVGTIYYERVAGYSREEAYFCSLPGGLHIMTMYAEERGVDIRLVSLAHALRITFVVMLATSMTNLVSDLPTLTVRSAAVSFASIARTDLVLLSLAGLVGWLVGRSTGLPGAQMVGPMICSGALHISGITNARPPVELIIAAQTILGAYIGARYVGENIGSVLTAMRYAFGHVILMLALGAVFASFLHLVFDLPLITGILSFAPGGMSEIGLIALALGLDVGFVATVQLCRLASINLFGPYVYRHIQWLLAR